MATAPGAIKSVLALIFVCALLSATPVLASDATSPHDWYATHDKAVRLARKGENDKALPILRKLYHDHGNDAGVVRDYIAVLSWTGNDAEAIRIYRTLSKNKQPDYVLLAVGRSFQNTHEYTNALELYRAGLRQSPGNVGFVVGEIESLAALGQTREALQRVDDDVKTHGKRPEITAAGERIRHDVAVADARAGQNDVALTILSQLHQQHPEDITVLRDYIAVSGWSGRDADAVRLYADLPNGQQPDYVLEAAARAYRNLHRPDLAANLYLRGLRQSPTNVGFAAGSIRSLTEAGYIEKALFLAADDLRLHGDRIEVLLAAADSADQFGKSQEALLYYQRALQIDPRNAEALHGVIMAYDAIGKARQALRMVLDNPNAVSAAEQRHIEADAAAELFHVALQEPTEAARNGDIDRVLAAYDNMIQRWSAGTSARNDLNRVRADRILALHERSRMTDVVNDYNRLLQDGAPIPTYILGAVGDAYLAMHQPETARDILVKAVAADPKNYETRRALFYATVDCGDYDEAYRIADGLAADPQLPPDQHHAAQLLAGAARLYGNQVREANQRIIPVVAATPAQPSSREALGNLYDAQGWPRQALAQYQSGVTLAHGENRPNEIGVGQTELELQNYAEAEAKTASLVRRYPDNAGVQRLDDSWQSHEMWELRIRAGYDFNPMTTTNVTGGEGYGIDTALYSPPIAHNWRIFADEYLAHQHEPNAEGSIGLSSTEAGVDYRKGPVNVSVAPTLGIYSDRERPGVAVDSGYAFDDQWSIGAHGESFTRDTPLRALNSGVTASAFNGSVRWRENELQQVRVGGNLMPFSDGNFRSGFYTDYERQIYAAPYWTVDALASAGESQNSADSNRVYYNPSRDFMALGGARVIETLYQRYTTLYQHSLRVEPGFYWERYYGGSAALRMRYEQRLFFGNNFEAGAGVNFSRQSYDGAPENDVSLTADLTKRF